MILRKTEIRYKVVQLEGWSASNLTMVIKLHISHWPLNELFLDLKRTRIITPIYTPYRVRYLLFPPLLWKPDGQPRALSWGHNYVSLVIQKKNNKFQHAYILLSIKRSLYIFCYNHFEIILFKFQSKLFKYNIEWMNIDQTSVLEISWLSGTIVGFIRNENS